MELQPEKEKVEKFAWKWLHPWTQKTEGVTYIQRSRQSTSCCGEGWIWSIRQISQQHPPSPRHRLRNLSFSATESEKKYIQSFCMSSWDFKFYLLCLKNFPWCFSQIPNPTKWAPSSFLQFQRTPEAPPQQETRSSRNKLIRVTLRLPCAGDRRSQLGWPSQRWPTGSRR